MLRTTWYMVSLVSVIDSLYIVDLEMEEVLWYMVSVRARLQRSI